MQCERRPLEAKLHHTSVTLMGLMSSFGALDNAAILPPAQCALCFWGRYPAAIGRIQSLATSLRNEGSLRMSHHIFLLSQPHWSTAVPSLALQICLPSHGPSIKLNAETGIEKAGECWWRGAVSGGWSDCKDS